MTDLEFKKLEEQYYAEKHKRDEIDRIESKIRNVDKILDDELTRDGYTSYTHYALSVTKSVDYDGHGHGDSKVISLDLENMDAFRYLMIEYKHLLEKVLKDAKKGNENEA